MKRAVNCNKDALELAYGYDVEEKWKPIIEFQRVKKSQLRMS